MTAMIMHNPTAMPLRPEASGFWRNSLAASLALALHAGVLVALVLGWSVDKPQVETPPVLTTQLVMLAPPAAPAEPLPAVAEVAPPPPPAPAPEPEPARPRVAPQVQAQKLEQAALARKRVEDKKREQVQEQQRQQRDTEQRVAQEQAQAQRAEQSRLAAERTRQQAAQAAADSRQYQPLSKEAPDYPQRALDKNLEGDCTVEYSVNPQGRVENPKVIEGCHPLFMRPSLAAVATFRYQPRLIDGQAVTVPAVRNTFHYRIH
ncbi:energy transducer TonB [Pseudomonas sp. NFPP19]|uniref:energy transducer TonB n=1 Tax=Pseudomonas sp. NFPP19 TaxID=1566225 RepID=UPI0008ACB6BE|nr:energy transducer TonB [Pseudomonas sp. NFPP19]SES27255.1 outer membrane transport energization protein TonB [Pseudomonas sp. NFPP19]